MPRPSDIRPSLNHPRMQLRRFAKLCHVVRDLFRYEIYVAPEKMTARPLVIFPDLESLKIRMGLKDIWPAHFDQKHGYCHYPETAPLRHDADRFAQYVLDWQPIEDDGLTRAKRTLVMKVAADDYMISALFVPLEDSSDDGFQLDKLTLYYGHQIYPITVDACQAPTLHHQNLANALLITAAETITSIRENPDFAAYTLSEGCRPVYEAVIQEHPGFPKPPSPAP